MTSNELEPLLIQLRTLFQGYGQGRLFETNALPTCVRLGVEEGLVRRESLMKGDGEGFWSWYVFIPHEVAKRLT
jgi:hypothetical protein